MTVHHLQDRRPATMTSDQLATQYVKGNWAKANHRFHGTQWKVGRAKAVLDSSHHQTFRRVWSVSVPAKHRRKGHGRRLMQVLTAYADAEALGLDLFVDTDNEAAINLYRSFGFTITRTNNAGNAGKAGANHYMMRLPLAVMEGEKWEAYFKAEALRLERDNEPRLGSDHWVAFFDALHKARMEDRERPDRARHTGSPNYEENSRRLYCDATGAALLAAGWTVTRTTT
jgi:GNAT superfamily N-acetyltransferase